MTTTITNNRLSVSIAETGAELKSLREHATGLEYIWQSDPTWWNGAAPILFPIIGGLKDDACYINGTQYSIPSHGFVRKKEWNFVGSTGTSACFETTSDAETKAMYPWDFSLKVTYTLDNNALAVRYDVANRSSDRMYFSIGSHPAFNLPFAGGYLQHYYFEFSEEEDMERYFFDNGCHLNETEPIFDNCRQIYMRPDLFNRGPIIFKHPRSTDFTIRSSQRSKYIRVATDGVPYVALWSKGNAAPFACIEPWYGIPDNIDTNQDFEFKEGIMSLEGGMTFDTTYRIEICG